MTKEELDEVRERVNRSILEDLPVETKEMSIDEAILRKTFTERRIPFTISEKLIEERMALKWKDEENPKALIKKSDMKLLIGHSPDFIEALMYCIDRVDHAKKARKVRRGNWDCFTI